jgi:predicted nucleic acid-binding protein
MITIYLDVCCLNRPFDDQAQARIRLESEAVLLILGRIHSGEWRWAGSVVLNAEIARNPDRERANRVEVLLQGAAEIVALDDKIEERGLELEALGFGAFDALHLAAAERAGVDVFLTTDDELVRRAQRHEDRFQIRIANPLAWLNERSQG